MATEGNSHYDLREAKIYGFAPNSQGGNVIAGETVKDNIISSTVNQTHSGTGDNVAGDKTSNINQNGNFGVGVNQGEIGGNAKVAGVINEGQQQDLASAAAEIQRLLEQLSQTYPTNTTREKLALATEAITQIEQNPSLMHRLLSAAKAGSLAAIEQMLNHPAASFVMAAVEDFKETGEIQ